jgi:hypothetical protein
MIDNNGCIVPEAAQGQTRCNNGGGGGRQEAAADKRQWQC